MNYGKATELRAAIRIYLTGEIAGDVPISAQLVNYREYAEEYEAEMAAYFPGESYPVASFAEYLGGCLLGPNGSDRYARELATVERVESELAAIIERALDEGEESERTPEESERIEFYENRAPGDTREYDDPK